MSSFEFQVEEGQKTGDRGALALVTPRFAPNQKPETRNQFLDQLPEGFHPARLQHVHRFIHERCPLPGMDAEAAGFDEGEKPADWRQSLSERGITVRMDVLRQEANRVFDLYARRGGEIYNVEGQGER